MSKSMSIGNQIHRQELAIAGSTLYTKEMPKEAGVAGGSLKRAVVRIRDLAASQERAKQRLKVLDHCAIFLLIAGTYTPLCLLALPPAWGIPLLVAVWVAAIGGVITKMTMLGRGPGSAGSWLYIVIGWAAVVAVPVLVDRKSVV